MSADRPLIDRSDKELIALVEGLVGEIEARGWLRVTTIAEDLFCAIHREIGIDVPEGRFEEIQNLLDVSLKRDSFN